MLVQLLFYTKNVLNHILILIPRAIDNN